MVKKNNRINRLSVKLIIYMSPECISSDTDLIIFFLFKSVQNQCDYINTIKTFNCEDNGLISNVYNTLLT